MAVTMFKHLNWPNSNYLHQLMFLHLLDLILKFRDRERWLEVSVL